MADRKRTGYPYFGVPPAREPRPASLEPSLTGKRVVLSTPDGFVYDMRAAGEVRTDGNGGVLVDIMTEPQWFARRAGLAQGETASWPVHLVWVE
jgi:hypothetical protein